MERLTGVADDNRWGPSNPDGQPRRALNASRVWERFGFVAGATFEEGLEKTTKLFGTLVPR